MSVVNQAWEAMAEVSLGAAALAGLTLGAKIPGWPRFRAWGSAGVLGGLPASASLMEAQEALRRSGLREEADALSPGCMAAGREAITSGFAITALCGAYPCRWAESLGQAAPMALFRSGPMPPREWLAVVGSRDPLPEDAAFIGAVVAEAAKLGLAIGSGGARGVDQLARDAALRERLPIAEFWPTGIGRHPSGVSVLSEYHRHEGFSSLHAMQRNALIYAGSVAAVVLRPRLRAGGSWHGASDALRRRLCRVIVFGQGDEQAIRALVAQGALLIADPSELPELLARPANQGDLFGSLTA